MVASIAGFLVYREATREGKPGVISIGQQAPDFTIKDESGRDVKLSDYRGKLVFLNFWATWCVPCVTEMPEMEMMNQAFKDRKFQILAISVDTDWEPVKKFYKEHSLTFPSFLDPGKRVPSLYGVRGWPETFIIAPNGSVLKYIVGPQKWADPRVLASIESMIPDSAEQQASTR